MGQQTFSEADFDGLVTTEAATPPAPQPPTLTPAQVRAAMAPPVETPATTPAPAETPAELPEQEPELEEVAAAPETPAPAKRKASPQARINEAIRKQRDAEREAEYWRTQATQPKPAESPRPVQTDPADPEPKLEDFATAEDPYLSLTKASARWAARQEAKTMHYAQVEQARATRYMHDMQSLITTLPNGKELKELSDTMPPPHPELRAAILDSESSARLVLYFAEHPEDYDSLQRLNGPAMYRALGTLEGRLTTAPSGPVAQARTSPVITPIQPVGTSPVSTTPAPEELEFGPEYIRQMNAKDRERKKLHF